MGKHNALGSSARPSPVSSVMGGDVQYYSSLSNTAGLAPRACAVMGSELNFEMSGDLQGTEQQGENGCRPRAAVDPVPGR